MDFLSNKAEHLAAHLRKAIAQGTLLSPLPSLREWSSTLSVSTSTLQAALKILKREGLIASRSRSGYYLVKKRPNRRSTASPVVRWIWHDPKHRGQPPAPELLTNLGKKLASQGIGLNIERCDANRIQAIRRAGSRPDELLLFSTLSTEQQRHFHSLPNTLLLGLPHPDAPLPYISSDIFPAIRHACYKLCRSGCQKVDLLHIVGRRLPESIERIAIEFQHICQQAPHPMEGRVIWLPSDPVEQIPLLRKMIPDFSQRHGLIINAPLSPSLVIMVLSHFGVKIPEQVTLLPVNVLPGQMVVFPPLAYYPYPLERICSLISKSANHYFSTGKLPILQHKIALTLIEP